MNKKKVALISYNWANHFSLALGYLKAYSLKDSFIRDNADIEIIDQMASPLAGSYVLLEGDQKMKGCVLANIGAETVSIVVYDEGIPMSVKVFPMVSVTLLGATNVLP